MLRLITRLAVHPDEDVRWSVAQLLGSTGDHRALDLLVRFVDDVDPDVRWQVAYGVPEMLAGAASPVIGIEALAVLAHDDDDEGVRDRACLGLGLFTDIDTADIRASLHRAVHGHADSDEAADEALVSLSGRGDTTIPPTLLRRLDPAANPRPLVVRAALELAHAKTYAALRDLRSSGWHDVAHPTLLVEAIAACAPG